MWWCPTLYFSKKPQKDALDAGIFAKEKMLLVGVLQQA
jgi:hypothetical protein